MHSKLFKAETTDLFSNDKFINYNEISNVVVKSTEDGETRFYCRKPDGCIHNTHSAKVELASKPKYKWCSDHYGSKNVEICQAKAIGIGRLSSAIQGNGRGSYCWADIEVRYNESEDLYKITYIPHATIVNYVYAERNISGVLYLQFRDYGQPTGTSRARRNRSRRRYGNPRPTGTPGGPGIQSIGRFYRSNFRFLSPGYYNSSFQGAQIVIPDIRYRYDTEVAGRDMRNLFIEAAGVGRNIANFNKAQIVKNANISGQIYTPLIGALNTRQFDPNSAQQRIEQGLTSKCDVNPLNNDINSFSGNRGTRNSVRNNKHRLEIKCRYVLCVNHSGYGSDVSYVRRCNSQVFTGVVQLGGTGRVKD